MRGGGGGAGFLACAIIERGERERERERSESHLATIVYTDIHDYTGGQTGQNAVLGQWLF